MWYANGNGRSSPLFSVYMAVNLYWIVGGPEEISTGEGGDKVSFYDLSGDMLFIYAFFIVCKSSQAFFNFGLYLQYFYPCRKRRVVSFKNSSHCLLYENYRRCNLDTFDRSNINTLVPEYEQNPEQNGTKVIQSLQLDNKNRLCDECLKIFW